MTALNNDTRAVEKAMLKFLNELALALRGYGLGIAKGERIPVQQTAGILRAQVEGWRHQIREAQGDPQKLQAAMEQIKLDLGKHIIKTGKSKSKFTQVLLGNDFRDEFNKILETTMRATEHLQKKLPNSPAKGVLIKNRAQLAKVRATRREEYNAIRGKRQSSVTREASSEIPTILPQRPKLPEITPAIVTEAIKRIDLLNQSISNALFAIQDVKNPLAAKLRDTLQSLQNHMQFCREKAEDRNSGISELTLLAQTHDVAKELEKVLNTAIDNVKDKRTKEAMNRAKAQFTEFLRTSFFTPQTSVPAPELAQRPGFKR